MYVCSLRTNKWSYDHRQEGAALGQKMSYIRQTAGDRGALKDIQIFGMSSWLRQVHDAVLKLFRDFQLREQRVRLLGDLAEVALTFLRNGAAYGYLLALALGEGLSGEHTAVKLSTGEPPASNYLDPNLIADLVHEVNGTIVENNTAYGGQRASTAMHYQVAEDHGFASIADFVVLDEDGSVSLPVEGGTQLTENLVGAHFPEYDGYLVLSHFKGHAMAGFGGAIKNISIGMASQEGKCLIHTAGESHTSPWGGEQDPFTESMAEAGKSVVDALDGNILYVSVMNHLSIDCDCDGNPAEPDMHDMGILASTDPVALDQACVDLVYASQDDTASLIERMESRNAVHVLEHGEEIGLGNRDYRMVSIDD